MALSTDRVDVYPVGLLADLLHLRKATSEQHPDAIRWALGRLRGTGRYLTRCLRRRMWRELKNTFNGYLAEPYDWPKDGSLRRCGSGWTKRRALRSLHRHGYR